MGDLSDWMWLLVAVAWVVLRLLPRLFKSGGSSPAPKPRPRRADAEQRTGTEILKGGGQPPPIVPR